MKFKKLLTIFSVVASLAGISCVLMPNQMLANYGLSLSPMSQVIYQFWGSTLLGIGLIGWFVKDVKDMVLQKKLALALFITSAIGTALAVKGQYSGANDFGWSNVATFGLLALAFGLFMILKPRK